VEEALQFKRGPPKRLLNLMLQQTKLPSLRVLPWKGRTPHRQSRLDSRADYDLCDFKEICLSPQWTIFATFC
jgi:hypothetical protein